MKVKKLLLLMGFLTALCGSAKGQLFDVAGDFFTNSPRDSAAFTFQMLSHDAKLDTTFDSIVILRYRVNGAQPPVFVDRIGGGAPATTDTFPTVNYNNKGSFVKGFRASDGSGTIGHYIVRALGFKGTTLRQYGFDGYTVYDSSNAATFSATRRPMFGTLSTDSTRSLGTSAGTFLPIAIDAQGEVDLDLNNVTGDLGAAEFAGDFFQEAKDTLRKMPNNSSFIPNLDFELSDVTGLNNTPTGWIQTSASATEHLGTAPVKQGRFSFTPWDGTYNSVDSTYLGLGHRVYFGAWMWGSTASWGTPPVVRLLRTGGGAVTLLLPGQANAWTWRDTVVNINIASLAGVYHVNLTGDGDADSFFVDDIHFVSLDPGDSAANARAAWDNDVVPQVGRIVDSTAKAPREVDVQTWLDAIPDALSSGKVPADVKLWLTGVPDGLSSGKLPADVKLWLTALPNVLTSGNVQGDLRLWLGLAPDALSSGKVPSDLKLWLATVPLSLTSAQKLRVKIDAADSARALSNNGREFLGKSNLGSPAQDSSIDAINESAGGGGCTVTFSAGTGNRTVTITTKDSGTVLTPVQGAIVSVLNSTGNLVAQLLSDVNGVSTFTLNDGTYYIKTFKPISRPIYGSSPNPQDSITLIVSGNGSRTDTIEVGSIPAPPLAGQVTLQGNINNVTAQSVEGATVVWTLNQMAWFSTDDTTNMIAVTQAGSATTDASGLWSINLYPTTKMRGSNRERGVYYKVVYILPDDKQTRYETDIVVTVGDNCCQIWTGQDYKWVKK